MNRNRLTASRSPSRRRPRLFSRSPAPARARARVGAARAAPRAHRRSGHRARRARSAPAAPTAAATRATPRDRRRSPPASDPFQRRGRLLHAETPADTAFGTSASLAWPDSLSAGPDSPALSCPPNRGHSNDHSRLAYAELLPDERAVTVVAFTERALAFFARHGIEAKRLMTDNAWCSTHSHAFRSLLNEQGIKHLTIEPYRPRTNGKVERFHQTMAREWAYGVSYRSSRDRAAALPHWLHHYG